MKKIEKQQMPGIKHIEQPFESSALFAVIQRKRDKAEPRRAIVPHGSRKGQKSHARAAPEQGMLMPEHIEQENRNNGENGVVRPQKERQNSHGDHGQDPEDGPAEGRLPRIRLLPAADPGEQHQRQNGEKEGQHDVLVRKADGAVKSQVKGDLADQGKDAHAKQILPFISRVRVALGDAKGKNRHGKPADHPRPKDPREENIPHMIKDHADDGKELQRCPVQDLRFFDSLHRL